ncbi:MAG: uroporphyrinogen-III C-methyltransferase [Treponema sp.]|jgi:uroporphyrinogen III methyltransferase/synthase|nr:uroporphyrinogen-III C-methyltransferase [Treponema sp.]
MKNPADTTAAADTATEDNPGPAPAGNAECKRPPGKVWLVGAGPGDRGLLTLKGKAVLDKADVVVHDRLVSEDILLDLPPAVRLVDAGKSPGNHRVSQEDIHRILIAEARAGRKVVRLKGGDPFLFGRGAEEMLALREAGIPCEVIPGISSALGVPALAGIPVTHRGLSSGLHVITWRDREGSAPSPALLRSLAGAGGTLAILMGGSALGEIGRDLIKAGFPPDLPAAIIENGSSPLQKVRHLALEELAALPPLPSPPSPTLVLAGAVCSLAGKIGPEKPEAGRPPPLEGLRIVVTRPEPRNAELCRLIEELGGKALPFPCIRTIPLPGLAGGILREAGTAEWFVFTSAAGVDIFFDAYLGAGGDFRSLGGKKFAALGPATGEALARRGFIPDFVPRVYNSAALGEGLAGKIPPGETALLARARLGSPELPRILAERGLSFRQLVLYDTVPAEGNPRARRIIEAGRFDLVFFSSPSMVSAFARAFPALDLSRLPALCAGESTVNRARELGMSPQAVEETGAEAMCRKAAALNGKAGNGE